MMRYTDVKDVILIQHYDNSKYEKMLNYSVYQHG